MLEIDFIFTDDLQLTVSIEERNEQSMDYFYDKYSAALYGTIYRITNSRHLAEECLTATFVKAWNEMAAFRLSGDSLFTWLLHMARKTAFELITKEKARNLGTHNIVDGHDQHYSPFELVYSRGFTVLQAAELSGITELELTTNIRKDLQNRTDKTDQA